MKEDIMELDAAMFFELRSYMNPPQTMYTTIKATYVLLGEKSETVHVR